MRATPTILEKSSITKGFPGAGPLAVVSLPAPAASVRAIAYDGGIGR